MSKQGFHAPLVLGEIVKVVVEVPHCFFEASDQIYRYHGVLLFKKKLTDAHKRVCKFFSIRGENLGIFHSLQVLRCEPLIQLAVPFGLAAKRVIRAFEIGTELNALGEIDRLGEKLGDVEVEVGVVEVRAFN